MVKVENKETLRLLTKRFMKMNRARNIIAVIAIMLTSLLFTSLFVGSVSMILSKRATEIKQFMDSSHAIAQNLSEEDAERLQKTIEQSDEVERYGTGIFLGAGRDKHFGFSVEVRYADKNMAEKYIKELSIKTPSMEQLTRNLSGGNQQKVVLAKSLASNSDIIIFDEPTRGIDVGAKKEIYVLMNELAKKGMAIIMISSEMQELLGMSDRIIVMHEGEMMGELKKEDATQEKILELASGIR